MKSIKGFIKEIIGFIFRFSGVSFLIREVFCKNNVTIIFYHDPKPEIFKRHIEYLSKHHNSSVNASIHYCRGRRRIFFLGGRTPAAFFYFTSIPPRRPLILMGGGIGA